MGATATAEGFPEANTVSLIGNDPWDSVSTLVETRHDLLNALAVIHGYEQLLRHRLGQSAEPKDLQALDAIRSNISRAVQLLRPPDHAPVSRCDLEVLLEQARYGVPPERYIDITVHVAGGSRSSVTGVKKRSPGCSPMCCITPRNTRSLALLSGSLSRRLVNRHTSRCRIKALPSRPTS